MTLPANALTVSCLFMLGPMRGFAGTGNGWILRFDGNAWTRYAQLPGNEGVLSLWSDGTLLFAGGLSGSLYVHDGTRFQSHIGSGVRQWNSIWGFSASEVYGAALQQNGTALFRFDGSALAMIHGTTGELRAVWGAASGQLFVGATQGRILHLDAGTVFEETVEWPMGMTSNDIALFSFEGVGLVGGAPTAVGSRHAIYRREGSTWRPAYTPFLSGDLRAVVSGASSEGVAAGYPATGGPLATLGQGSWASAGFDDGFDLFAAAAVGPGDYFVAGGVRSGLDGVIFRSRR